MFETVFWAAIPGPVSVPSALAPSRRTPPTKTISANIDKLSLGGRNSSPHAPRASLWIWQVVWGFGPLGSPEPADFGGLVSLCPEPSHRKVNQSPGLQTANLKATFNLDRKPSSRKCPWRPARPSCGNRRRRVRSSPLDRLAGRAFQSCEELQEARNQLGGSFSFTDQ